MDNGKFSGEKSRQRNHNNINGFDVGAIKGTFIKTVRSKRRTRLTYIPLVKRRLKAAFNQQYYHNKEMRAV